MHDGDEIRLVPMTRAQKQRLQIAVDQIIIHRDNSTDRRDRDSWAEDANALTALVEAWDEAKP
jgi:hypothetical protein